MLGAAVQAVRRRSSFSVRFAVILAVLGLLIAGATAAIPLQLAAQETRSNALDRAADKAAIAVNLIGTQRSSLQSYVGGVAGQVQGPLGSGDRSTATQVLVRQSAVTPPDDVLGAGYGPVLRAGTPLAQTDLVRVALLRAVDQAQDLAVDGDGTPWLVERMPVPGAEPTEVFVARPLNGSFITRLAAVLGSGADAAALAVVHNGRYVSGATADGDVNQGAALPDNYLPATHNIGGAVIVRGDHGDVAASVASLGNGVWLLVTTAVGSGSGFLSTVVGPVALIVVAMILLALLVVFVVVQRDLQRPLHRLSRVVDAMEREDFDMPIPVGDDDELGRLGRSFERMRTALRATLYGAEARAALAGELNATQPLHSALQKVCRLLRDTTGSRVALIVVDHTEMSDAFITAEGELRNEDAPQRLLAGAGPIAEAMRMESAAPLQATATPDSPEAEMGLHELCAAPLRIGTNVLGAVALADKEQGYNHADLELVSAAAEQVVLALERYRILAVAQRQASTDELTGLYNYRFLVDYLDQQIALAERLDAPLAVLMLDLDRFKHLNDTHGHHAGDEALRAFAQALLATVRRSDLAARYGGEEFVVVMSNTNREEARLVAEKIRNAVSDLELRFGGTRVQVTVSIGGVAYPDDTGDARQLLRLADEALYRAKRGGRDRVCFVSDSPRRRTLAPTGAQQSGQSEDEDERDTGHRPAQ